VFIEALVEIKDTDRYRRAVCILKIDGVDINRRMIELGFALAYIEYLKDLIFYLL